jgi:hypothetical protein
MSRRVEWSEGPHSGINISRIVVGGGVAGMLAALSIVVIGLIGVPLTRWFLAGSLALGALIALFLRWLARDRG